MMQDWTDVQVSNGAAGQRRTVLDWTDLKRRIMAALGPDGVFREFGKLGVKFDGGYNAKGKATCHAMDRPDERPSAFVDVRNGVYHSSGDIVETLNLFDFALKYGGPAFGDWLGTVKHYAGLAGIEIEQRKDGKGRILEAVYRYEDDQGELLYEVIRYRLANGKKDFRQRRPDGRGGWVYDLEGVARVLYRLPAIAANPAHEIWIVEGEKDADRLYELCREAGAPVVVTTSAQGANDTGRWDTYAEGLRGRRCVVLPDNDVPGLRHARGVCQALHGFAATIKLVELAGVGPKGDVSDWLDQGHTLDDLWSAIVQAPPWDPSAAPAPEEVDANRDATAADLVAANAGTRWLWPQWIPFGVLTLLTAEPSTGKTRLGLDLTKRISLGGAWPDGAPIDLQGRRPVVLWVPADSQHSELADAPAAFGFPPEAVVLNTTVGNLYGGTELEAPDDLREFEQRITRQNPAMVLIDTVTNTTELKSQDTADAKRQYKPLQEIAKKTGAAIVCVTHTNLAGKTLGRRADEKTRVTIRLECPDPEGQPTRRKLSVALSRVSIYPPALGVTMGADGNQYDGAPPESPVDQAAGKKPKLSPATQRAIGWLVTRLAQGHERIHILRKECDAMSPPINAKALYEARDYLDLDEVEMPLPGSTKDYKWWRLTSQHGSNGQCGETADPTSL